MHSANDFKQARRRELYQSSKHRTQSVWAQSGSTILRLTSRQIPHSSSLSVSTAESCSSLLLNFFRQSLCFLSSSSVMPLGSCSSDGKMMPIIALRRQNRHSTGLLDGTKGGGLITVELPDAGLSLPIRKRRRRAVRVHLSEKRQLNSQLVA